MRLPLLAVALLLSASACVPQPGTPGEVDIGRIDVYVRDQGGVPLDSVLVRLLTQSGAQVEEGRTGRLGQPGYHMILRSSGEFQVQVVPPAGYTVPATQTNPVPATIRNGAETTLNFTLAAE